jgi:F-type H+-transporting ATPase subunit delta
LIGGVLVRAGDKVIDGSIKGQLQHMQKALQ